MELLDGHARGFVILHVGPLEMLEEIIVSPLAVVDGLPLVSDLGLIFIGFITCKHRLYLREAEELGNFKLLDVLSDLSGSYNTQCF